MENKKLKITHSVFGAKGSMGVFLTQTLADAFPVKAVFSDSNKEVVDEALKADVIWLSVPRKAIDSILFGRKLSKKQLVVDICSIKKNVGDVIEKSGAIHLSLHPLHGAKVPLIGQRWAIIETPSGGEKSVLGKQVIEFFKKLGVAFLPPCTQSQHDFMMALTLSVPEILTVILDEIIKKYSEGSGKNVPTQEELMRWAVPASNSIFGAYTHIVNSTPEWLRYEIVKEVPGDLIEQIKKACGAISGMSIDDVQKKLHKQGMAIEKVNPAERDRVRRWVNQWFVDSTKTFFKTAKESRVKPTLRIQWMEDKNEIFPAQKKVMTVGIHGIDGCFTQEAMLRFLEENKIPESRVRFNFLVTAENVLKAIDSGETDLGIFAIANSGSGAYVSSMAPLAKYTFKVKAVIGMEIMQCLLAHKSIKTVEDIKEIFGHPQAVSQCKRTLEESYPKLKVVSGKDSDDTALCAERIALGKLPNTTATLASQIAATRYGLNIVSYNMHHDPFNTTTFLLISKS